MATNRNAPLESRAAEFLTFDDAARLAGGLYPPHRTELDLAELWQDLISGRLFMRGARHLDGRCYAIFERGHGGPVGPLPRRILELALLGQSLKVLSIDLCLSQATISHHCSKALSTFSCERHFRRVPILLVAAVHAARGVDLPRVPVWALPPKHSLVASFPLPGDAWGTRLSSSERDVMKLILEGKSHREIASARRTAVRTTSNQVGSVFQKLGVSGQSELRARAISSRILDERRESTC